MFSHITLGTNDLDRARAFYEPVMATLVFGELAGQKLFIVSPFDGGTAGHGNGTHTAFLAGSRAIVDAFHAAALVHGGSDEGAPGPRPHYHANYYGAYVRDPDGNKLQAVCHGRLNDGAA